MRAITGFLSVSSVVCLMLYGGAAFAEPSVLPSASDGQAVTGRVEGKVVFKEQPVEGVDVYAVQDADGLSSGSYEGTGVKTGPTGAFTLDLPKGLYYIVARKGSDGGALETGDLYCFYGGNPVTVEPTWTTKIVLNSVRKPSEIEDGTTSDDKGVVEGIVTFEGRPLEGVEINAYTDLKGSLHGRGRIKIPPTGADGKFEMKADEGTYYIIARKRMSREPAGPLHGGDYFGYLDINPVAVRKGVIKRVNIPVVKKVERASTGQGSTHIKGIVKDGQGSPVPGVYVCLYTNEAMAARPALVSKPTGQDGVFAMDLPGGGKFFLGARSRIGGPLAPGQSWGRYSGSPDHSITVETGKTLDGLAVIVKKVTDE